MEYGLAYGNGQALPQSRLLGLTQQGVGNGAITLTPEAAGGNYTLLARGLREEFRAPQLAFGIDAEKRDLSRTNVILNKSNFSPGEEARLRLFYKATSDEAGVKVLADLDGKAIKLHESLEKAERGTYTANFRLPEDAKQGLNRLNLTLQREQEVESLATDFQVTRPAIEVKFYPEGGVLTPGVSNNVYFQAHDSLGKPVELKGALVDANKNSVAMLKTESAGRGKFALTPAAGVNYSPAVTQPANVEINGTPLFVASEAKARLSAVEGVIAASAPLAVDVATTDFDAKLVVAASIDGTCVGQQVVDFLSISDQASKTFQKQLSIPLADEAAGLMAVTLYDYEQSPPAPVAERWVYRQPATHWGLEATPAEANAETTTWNVQVRDETGKPGQAVLGARVVREDVYDAYAATGGGSLESFWWRGRHGARFDDAAATLGKPAGELKAEGMDLALGTQPTTWGFSRAGTDVLAVNGRPAHHWNDYFAPRWERLSETTFADDFAREEAPVVAKSYSPPLVVDNFQAVQEVFQRAVGTAREARYERVRMIANVLCVCSAGVLIALACFGAKGLVSSPRVWLPALSMACGAFVLAGSWVGGEIDAPVAAQLRPIKPYAGEAIVATTQFASFARLDDQTPSLAAAGDSPPTGSDRAWTKFRGADPRTGVAAKPIQRYAIPSQRGPEAAFPFGGTQLSGEPTNGQLNLPAAGTPAAIEPETLARLPRLPVRTYSAPADDGSSPPTLYWNPLLLTDENGRATLAIPRPKGNQSYRLIIDAHGNGRIGSMERVIMKP
jgi:hypothetical protein